MAREVRRNANPKTPEVAQRLRIAQAELDTFVSGLSKITGYFPGMGACLPSSVDASCDFGRCSYAALVAFSRVSPEIEHAARTYMRRVEHSGRRRRPSSHSRCFRYGIGFLFCVYLQLYLGSSYDSPLKDLHCIIM